MSNESILSKPRLQDGDTHSTLPCAGIVWTICMPCIFHRSTFCAPDCERTTITGTITNEESVYTLSHSNNNNLLEHYLTRDSITTSGYDVIEH